MDNTISKIVEINLWLANFWKGCDGWAPIEAANIITKSRLDRQVSLSRCLTIWNSAEHSTREDGALILAWANLGSLIEGTLKLFLAIYYEDYKEDIEAFRKKNGNIIDPDQLTLEKLKIFFNKKELWSSDWYKYVEKVQHYRNAIHAFKNKEIGTFNEFDKCLVTYLALIEEFNLFGLPYPDEIYVISINDL